jgi:hypothetical protein
MHLKTAKQLSLSISPSLLALAHEFRLGTYTKTLNQQRDKQATGKREIML